LEDHGERDPAKISLQQAGPPSYGTRADAGQRRAEVAQLAGPSAAAADDNGDDNDDNQRRTIPATQHCLLTVAGHRESATVGYGSEGRGFESLRLRTYCKGLTPSSE
jgi:hypothetical protein